jgi:hypothetical protein
MNGDTNRTKARGIAILRDQLVNLTPPTVCYLQTYVTVPGSLELCIPVDAETASSLLLGIRLHTLNLANAGVPYERLKFPQSVMVPCFGNHGQMPVGVELPGTFFETLVGDWIANAFLIHEDYPISFSKLSPDDLQTFEGIKQAMDEFLTNIVHTVLLVMNDGKYPEKLTSQIREFADSVACLGTLTEESGQTFAEIMTTMTLWTPVYAPHLTCYPDIRV